MKHNNSLSPSLSRRCLCGRYITIGEDKAGIGVFNYTCPDCLHREHSNKFNKITPYTDYLMETYEKEKRENKKL